jgi:hypothetical protein
MRTQFYVSKIETYALVYGKKHPYTYVSKISIESTKHWTRAARSPIIIMVSYVGNIDTKGYSAIHLAVLCDGPDVDFEETVKVLNGLKNTL